MRKIISILLTLVLFIGVATPVSATQPKPDWKIVMEATLDWMVDVSPTGPQVGASVGEWAIIALARAERVTVDDPWVIAWLTNVESVLSEIDTILDANPEVDVNNPPATGTFPSALRRWTDYQRITLALNSLGLCATDFNGRDITKPFSSFVPSTQRHALNRTILADVFALISQQNKPACTERDLFLAHILDVQRDDGSWSLNPAQPTSALDIDITAMALQALAPYYHRNAPFAVDAIEKALTWLFAQDFDNAESTAQMIVALTTLGFDYSDDAAYYVELLLRWFDPSSGGFMRAEGPVNAISTVQAAYALVAYWRFVNEMTPLFDMGYDFTPYRLPTETSLADDYLPGMHQYIRRIEVIYPGRTFADVQNHANQQAIESLAARGIISGRSENRFEPDATMTRAEFATIITRGLGLPQRPPAGFDDVPQGAWFANAVATAYYFEIVSGLSATRFNPTGTLTRQEAAVMIARAARLCGIDTNLTDTEVLNVLAMFGDYRTAASWALESLAFCYRNGILDDDEFYIKPRAEITRSEVAEMLYRLLYSAGLI